ncbi:TraE/TraK family type IV conjugative transfer system protein [Methylomonas sp. UP202]|uniref:TraE/TraK family type IV conjugative transfer system protein n=1 Tax=Methylomonas sp. UP202 TaxID=3040943 RepID=UPI0024795889|nr:TraE/TraK family type IV conjugative transfer system protein [Methylomonas sp. UP202]WGS85083.1 TraE/TraK family type IV conjugative transfer system protein [Methylomonas sp. UP202]
MKLSDFLQTWDGHETENRFSRVIIIGLLVVCVITSLAAWRTERSIILVPPTLNKEVEVTRTSASSEFKESWGLFLAELLGNTTPANADFLKTAIEPLLAPDIYRSVLVMCQHFPGHTVKQLFAAIRSLRATNSR